MKLRGAFRRGICLFLSGLMLVMAPLCAYAGDYSVATGSDADPELEAWLDQMTGMITGDMPEESVVDIDSLPKRDLLSSLTEEQYQAYCQTFIDHPRTLLEWPEGVPRYRFVATLSAATVYVLYLLAAAVGIVFTWNLASWVQGYDGYEFFGGFEQYMRVMHAGAEDFWASWDAVMTATWGKAITGMKTMYSYLKEYCTAQMEGYGTEQPSYDITSNGSFSIVSDGDYFGENVYFDSRRISLGNITSPIYHYSYLYRIKSSSTRGRYFSYLVSQSSFSSDYEYSNVRSVGNLYVLNLFNSSFADIDLIVDYINGLGSIFMGEIFDEYMDVDAYFLSPDFALGGSSITVTPVKSIVDAQEKTFVSPADTLTLPVDQTAADTLASNVSAATDAAAVAGSLTGTWDLGDTQAGTDEEEPVLPWIPSITGWLEKLLHGIEAIPGELAGSISGVGEKVEALPGSIAQALENTLIGEDDGTYQISQVVTGKFPFCVPFDLVGCFRVLQAPAAPPVWRVPFVVDNSFVQIHEEIVIDLSDWERPAAVIRFFVLLMFIFGLAYVTRYVVKG